VLFRSIGGPGELVKIAVAVSHAHYFRRLAALAGEVRRESQKRCSVSVRNRRRVGGGATYRTMRVRTGQSRSAKSNLVLIALAIQQGPGCRNTPAGIHIDPPTTGIHRFQGRQASIGDIHQVMPHAIQTGDELPPAPKAEVALAVAVHLIGTSYFRLQSVSECQGSRGPSGVEVPERTAIGALP